MALSTVLANILAFFWRGLPVSPMVSRRSRVQGDRCAASLRSALSAALRRDLEG